MSWVTWRQHRLETLWALILALLLAGEIAYVANELRIADCSGLRGVGYCLPADLAGSIAGAIVRFNLFTYALVVFPALAGAFVGAPLVAREIENGTHRLAWTQGVTRTRWLLVKVALVFAPLLAMATLVGLLEVVLINVQGPNANRWAFFDQQAPMTVAATAFALALGVAAGAVVGRSVPAMAVTLLAFVVTRIGIAEIARGHYMAPLGVSTQDFTTLDTAAKPTAWWLDQAQYVDGSGHVLSDRQVADIGDQPRYFQAHGIHLVQHYQPGDRFWTFQTIEAAMLFALAALVLGFAIYWVARRVT